MRASTTLWSCGEGNFCRLDSRGTKGRRKTVRRYAVRRSGTKRRGKNERGKEEGVGWMDRFKEKERKKNGAGGGGARRSEVCQITEVRDINDS